MSRQGFEANRPMFFKKKIEPRSFTDILSALGAQKFDVAPAGEGSQRTGETAARVAGKREPSAYRVSKYGCAAEIAPAVASKEDKAVATVIVSQPGWVLNGQIARILDRGYQKFLETPKLTIVATADHLRAIHQFAEELDFATGGMMLYNESLGTTSNRYVYDRVKGRVDDFKGESGEALRSANEH